MRTFLGAALGCALVIGATAGTAGTIVQDFDLTASLNGGSIVQIDLNNDGADDFTIEIISSLEDGISQPLVEEGPVQLTEYARIRSTKAPNSYGSIAYRNSFQQEGFGESFFNLEGPYAAVFGENESIGFGDIGISFRETAILYAEGIIPVVAASLEPVYGFPTVSEGPFAETGTTGLIGLAVTTYGPDSKDTFFGWLEITRGSISVGTGAVSTVSGAPIGAGAVTAVPLPSGLALFAGAFGLMGFAARRRKAS